ncbi:MAG: DEAD/DEAH box helicase family protein [Thermoguttaceae bacterium]|nr:DEAD/DEAH box helicase family protein [Thermoguttaceae bacterium]
MSQKENEIPATVFQDKTANCIVEMFQKGKNRFQKGQNRVLLADEVGLGKTIVAKHVIKLMKQSGYKKIVYFCSNQSIANQNVTKLTGDASALHIFENRLSMIHLRIAEQLDNANQSHNAEQSQNAENDDKVVFIAMTPETSFNMSQKKGRREERALICCILEKYLVCYPSFQKLTPKDVRIKKLNELLNLGKPDHSNWTADKNKYKSRFDEVEQNYYELLRKKCKDSNELLNQSLKDRVKEELNDPQNFDGLIRGYDKKNFPPAISKFLNYLYEEYLKDNKIKLNNYTDVTSKLDWEDRPTFKDFFDYLFNKKPELDNTMRANVILHLRRIFAKIGSDCLNSDCLKPDLVILDEFQRYNYLISTGESDDQVRKDPVIQDLIDKLLHSTNNRKILLMSATPYKPYYTAAEEENDSSNSSSKEFKKLIHYLLGKKKHCKEFDDKWEEHSKAQKEFCHNPSDESVFSKAKKHKKAVEDKLKKILCRTERFHGMDPQNESDSSNSSFISNDLVKCVDISKGDVLSWINVHAIAEKAGYQMTLPVDFAKSCPYLMSFMGQVVKRKKPNGKRKTLDPDGYVDYNELFRWIKGNVKKADRKKLVDKNDHTSFIDPKIINAFGKLPANNARLQQLIDIMFPKDKHTEYLLWVPASRPYYKTPYNKTSGKTNQKDLLRKAYTENAGFSKALLFSHWNMVPKMTAALVSYESERRIYTVFNKLEKRRNKIYYFTKNIHSRLTPANRKLLTYPSEYLASIDIREIAQEYIQDKGEDITLDELYAKVEDKIKDDLKDYFKSQKSPAKGTPQKYRDILEKLDILGIRDGNTDDEEDASVFPEDYVFPQNTASVLAWLAIASPAVCALRTLDQNWKRNDFDELLSVKNNDDDDDEDEDEEFDEEDQDGDDEQDVVDDKNDEDEDDDEEEEEEEYDDEDIEDEEAVQDDEDDEDDEQDEDDKDSCLNIAKKIATSIVSLFAKIDSQTIIDIVYDADNKTPYYQHVVQYCAEGNLQAVLDEFAFKRPLTDFCQLFFRKSQNKQNTGYPEEGNQDNSQINTNDGYTCSIVSSDSIETGTKNAFLQTGKDKENFRIRTGFACRFTTAKDDSVLRNAFNSPFRPFVLASTSIGQEGLDFHSYCRKIIHWNLPSNPIDLEQREGRINRFLSLAIRQSLANSDYATGIPIQDYWKTLVEKIASEDNNKTGGMVPYWILPEDFEFKYPIERIVPMYPCSKDQDKYNWIIKVLSMYRLTLGQPNQEELLRSLDNANIPKEQLQKQLQELFFNLSPFFRNRK